MLRAISVCLVVSLTLLALSARAEEKKTHEPGGESPLPVKEHSEAPAECPSKDKPKPFDDQASLERQIRFTPLMKDGKLEKLHVQICKGDPLSCVGYIKEWKRVVEDRDLELSKDDQLLVEQALKKDGKYLYYPDRIKDDAKRKELAALDKVARHIVSEGSRLDPGTFEPKPIGKDSNEAAMLTGFFQPRPRGGARIYPPTASDAIYYLPAKEEDFRESQVQRKKDESNLANQIYQSILFAGKSIAPLREEMRKDGSSDLKRIHQIRTRIAPSVAFLKSVLKQHADERGRAKVDGSEFSELEWEFMDSRQPTAMLLRLDSELEQIERVTVAQDPNQACVLEQSKPIEAPDFSKLQLPQAEKNPEFSARIAISPGYNEPTKPLDDKDPKVREAALELFKRNPELLKTAKSLLSELHSQRDVEPTFDKNVRTTRGGKKFITDNKELVLAALPGLRGKPLTFETVRKYLVQKGHLDSIQFEIVPNENGNGFQLRMILKKGRRQVGWGGSGGYDLKDGKIPYAEMINSLAAMFGDKNAYNAYDRTIADKFDEAQKKEDAALKEELNRGIDDLLKLQQELGGKKATGTGER